MNFKLLFCCAARVTPSSFNMTKDKDKDNPGLLDPAPGAFSGHHEPKMPPSTFSTDPHNPSVSSDNQVKSEKTPVTDTAGAPIGGVDEKDTSSPSSSDANTPNTFSTDEQPKTQPQSDDGTATTPEDDETGWRMVKEPDLGTIHPDLELTDPKRLTRLLALLQNGWTYSHGRGPRHHDNCLWCRGPIESDIDILTHVGKDNSCKNSWPASCLMDWIEQDLDQATGYRLRCPMCSEEFCNLTKKYGKDFKARRGENTEETDPESILKSAWLRCIFFSPAFTREVFTQGKPIILMTGEEAQKLVLLGKEKVIFYQCEGLLDPVEAENKRKWLRRQYGDNLPYTIEQMTQMGIAQSEASAISFAYAQSAENPDRPIIFDKPLRMEPRFDTTWVIIRHGPNQYVMSPFLTEKIDQWIRVPSDVANVPMKSMTAEEFNDMARGDGGLIEAVKGYDAAMDEDIQRHRVIAESWLQQKLTKNKPEGVAGPKYEFWKRVKDAYDVKMNFRLAEEATVEDDGDDDWEDEDEDEV